MFTSKNDEPNYISGYDQYLSAIGYFWNLGLDALLKALTYS
jgi:hypothetical protein